MTLVRIALILPALLAAGMTTISGGPTAATAKPVADFTLTTTDGKPWSLHGQKAAKATVVAFLATECPMANGYLPILSDVATKYSDKGVRLVGVYPDPDTTTAQLAAHAKEYKVAFPVVRDPKHVSVSALSPKVTPEVVVLDETFAVRYRGRIDDGFVGRLKQKATTTRHDLVVALDEVLTGKPVTLPETKAFGCSIGEPEKAEPTIKTPVTYYKDVLPILQNHCQSCHRPDQVGPFALTSYKQAAKWADTCLEEVKAKRMPPWKPEKNDLLTGERTLPPEAVKVLQAWADQGRPEGDPKDAPAAPTFAAGWYLGEPDLILESSEDMTIGPDGRDLFRVLVFPTNLPDDRYVVAMEVKPGNPRVVHHTLQLVDTTGQARKRLAGFQTTAKPDAADRGPGYTMATMGWGIPVNPNNYIGGWAQGMLPKKLPSGVGQHLPKGADICLQMHFHRTGKVEKDRTRIGLYFSKVPVTQTYRSLPASGLIPFIQAIPAGEKAARVERSWRLTEDVTVYRLIPHMHLLGKAIELTATPAGGKEKTLIRLPEWDYNWQEQYELKEPLKLTKGTVLTVRGTYDNSSNNPRNPSSPPATTYYGEQATDEMCYVFLGVSTRSTARHVIEPVGGLFGK